MDEDFIVRLRLKLGIAVAEPIQADLPLAKSSCGFPAGSIEKIECMRQRVERGESVFHPQDNQNIVIRNSTRAS